MTSRCRRRAPRNSWKDPKRRQQFFEELAQELGIQSLDDWYRIKTATIIERGGGALLRKYYKGSLARALSEVYPEHPWQTDRFAKVPHRFWQDESNRRKFLDNIAKELNISKFEDWYKVTAEDVISRGGGGMMSEYYNNSLSRALRSLYPEHQWPEIESERVRYGHWKNKATHREFFDNLARELKIEKMPDDWYRVSFDDVAAAGGRGLLNLYYNSSVAEALRAVYPEYSWHVLKFPKAPKKYWDDLSNQRAVFDQLGREFGIKRLEDWYAFNNEDLQNYEGNNSSNNIDNDDNDNDDGNDNNNNNNNNTVITPTAVRQLMKRYGRSLARALQAVYPEFPWDMSKFSRAPNGFWRDLSNQRALFDQLGRDLGIGDLSDWYRITLDDVERISHRGMLVVKNYYGNSLARALGAIYPENQWQAWRFSRVPRSSSSSSSSLTKNNVHDGDGDDDDHVDDSDSVLLRRYIEAIASELSIQHLDDWYRVSTEQIRRHRGATVIRRNGGLALVLKKLFPCHMWDETRLAASSKKATQRALLVAIQTLFPNTAIMEDYLHPDLLFHKSGQRMELDIYLPALSLAFEYQGIQHSKDLHRFGSHAAIETHDSEKAAACQAVGITLISVPHWWDNTVASIAAAVREVRPDIQMAISTTTT